MNYIRNPVFPYTAFPWNDDDDTVAFAVLLENKEREATDATCEKIKTSLGLVHLDWGYIGGRALISIHKQDLPKVYEIINAFLQADYGLYIQDGTEANFKPGDVASYTRQQELRADGLQQLLEMKWDFSSLIRIALHLDDFWTIPRGKELAAVYRKRFRLKNEKDPEGMHTGEYLHYQYLKEQASKQESVLKEKE